MARTRCRAIRAGGYIYCLTQSHFETIGCMVKRKSLVKITGLGRCCAHTDEQRKKAAESARQWGETCQ